MRPDGFRGRLFGILMERTNKANYDLAIEVLKPASRQSVLEIGFGTGKLLERLARAAPGIHLSGVDPSETMVSVASARPLLKDSDLRVGAAEHLPWPGGTFDAAAALHSFQFWSDPDQALSELRRILKPGGVFLMMLRDHTRHAPSWLPNPISRSDDEISGAQSILESYDFTVTRLPGKRKTSNTLVCVLNS